MAATQEKEANINYKALFIQQRLKSLPPLFHWKSGFYSSQDMQELPQNTGRHPRYRFPATMLTWSALWQTGTVVPWDAIWICSVSTQCSKHLRLKKKSNFSTEMSQPHPPKHIFLSLAKKIAVFNIVVCKNT